MTTTDKKHATTADAPESASTAAESRERPGRRSLKIGLIALAVILVLTIAVVAGLFIGAGNSERVNASLTNLRDAIWAPEAGVGDHAEGDEHEHEKNGQYWTCGMHPWVILPEPGLCPICHMDLTPLDPSKLRGEITIDPVIVQNIGVRIAPVTEGPLAQRIRTVGTVTYNETAVRDVNTKIGGWIETLHVDAEGEPVESGEPLFDLYSPELYQAQEEYLLAWRARQERGALPAGAIDVLESARTRLQYFDISDEQIAALERANAPQKTLSIASPFSGIVIEKRATEGMRVEPGMTVYRVADLSTVWVQTTVYEHQLPLVSVGQSATVTLPYMPGRAFEGRVAYVYPYLNQQARQARVRLEFDNPDSLLKPGMYATVELSAPVQETSVLVPREAVITTGERQVAFVSLGDGRFEPRDVKTGLSTGGAGGRIQILEGLMPGEMVVTSGQFLLDSESRMREALAKMVTGEMASEQRPDVQMAKADMSATLPPEGRAALQSLLAAYLEIGKTLASDTMDGIKGKARAVAEMIGPLASSPPANDAHFWHKHDADVRKISEQAARLADVKDIDEARNAYGHLSDALDRIVTATGIPPTLGIEMDRRVCGMASDVPRNGVWLQPTDEDVRNPYMGGMMLRCNLPAEHRRLPVMGGDAGPSNSDTETPTAAPVGESIPGTEGRQ